MAGVVKGFGSRIRPTHRFWASKLAAKNAKLLIYIFIIRIMPNNHGTFSAVNTDCMIFSFLN